MLRPKGESPHADGRQAEGLGDDPIPLPVWERSPDRDCWPFPWPAVRLRRLLSTTPDMLPGIIRRTALRMLRTMPRTAARGQTRPRLRSMPRPGTRRMLSTITLGAVPGVLWTGPLPILPVIARTMTRSTALGGIPPTAPGRPTRREKCALGRISLSVSGWNGLQRGEGRPRKRSSGQVVK